MSDTEPTRVASPSGVDEVEQEAERVTSPSAASPVMERVTSFTKMDEAAADRVASPSTAEANSELGGQNAIYLVGGILAGVVALSAMREVSMIGWKFALLIPGALLLVAPPLLSHDAEKQRFTAYLAPLGAILVSVGLILTHTLRTGHHIAWAYSWLLILGSIVLSVDHMGMYVGMVHSTRVILRRVGMSLIALYAVVAVFLSHSFPLFVTAAIVGGAAYLSFRKFGRVAIFEL